MLEYFVPEDKDNDDTDFHTKPERNLENLWTRSTTKTLLQAKAEMQQKVWGIKIARRKRNKGEIYKRTFEIFPSYITALYNGCLRRGVFPTRWKRAKLIPLTKPGKENSENITKISPNKSSQHRRESAGESSDKHNHVFPPRFHEQKSIWIYATKEYLRCGDGGEGLRSRKSGSRRSYRVSLEVKGVLDVAWWPSILNGLKACDCPQNLYNVTLSYFSQRSAVLSTNSVRMQREVSKGRPQVSCCGPGFQNIQYDSLLNLKFTRRTKAVAFADDLILVIRGEIISEAENFSNLEMVK